MNNTIAWLVQPFQNMSSMLRGLYVISKLKFIRFDFSSQYLLCVNNISGSKLNQNELNLFEAKANLFKDLYPLNLLDRNTIDIEIQNVLNRYSIPSQIFITDRKTCFKCNHGLIMDRKTGVSAVLFSAFKSSELVYNFMVECTICMTKNYVSYCIVNEKKLEKRYFYSNALLAKYISFTKLTIYETGLFRVMSADIMYKHSSYQGFVESYNAVF